MGNYTAIYLHPKTIAEFKRDAIIRELSSLLRVTEFDILSVEKRAPFWKRPFLDPDDHFKTILRAKDVPIEEGILKQQYNPPFRTHMMFKFKDFMKTLCKEADLIIPTSISNGYTPWDTSIYNGDWKIHDFDTGDITVSGTFAFVLHANGMPARVAEYLSYLSTVPSVKLLLSTMENQTSVEWEISASRT